MISIPHVNASHARQARREAAEAKAETEAEAESQSQSRAEGQGRGLAGPATARGGRRSTRYRSKSCQALARLGAGHPAFRRHSREARVRLAVADMAQQVAALERRQALARSAQATRAVNASAVVAGKVAEYYRQFARGYDPERFGHAASRSKEAMLRSVMLEDVESPAFRNLDAFLVQWTHYSRYHAEMSTDCRAVECLDSGDPGVIIVKCSGVTTLRISRDTIRHFFKPMLEDEAMVQRLIGQQYSFPFVTLFYFNHTGRVFKMEPRADLAAGLFDLVSDPFTTVKLLGASKLSEDGCLHAYAE